VQVGLEEAACVEGVEVLVGGERGVWGCVAVDLGELAGLASPGCLTNWRPTLFEQAELVPPSTEPKLRPVNSQTPRSNAHLTTRSQPLIDLPRMYQLNL
jgi:hypothetical protein